jgi:hypothetical protein
LNIPTTLPELTELFRRLGARRPEFWAKSQIEEGIPQLQRFLFLRQAWSYVVGETATAWVDFQIEESEKDPRARFAGMGAAMRRARAAGISSEDILQIARGAQADMLSGLCYMLEDPGLHGTEVAEIGWGLFETDDDGNALRPIYSLHESVLDVDPSGREMGPADA